MGIRATEEGADLHTGFQKLCGSVTEVGLLPRSTTKGGGSMRLTADAYDRDVILVNIGGTVAKNVRVEQLP